MVKEALNDGVAWLMASVYTLYAAISLNVPLAKVDSTITVKILFTAFVVGFVTHLGKISSDKVVTWFKAQVKRFKDNRKKLKQQ